MKKIIQKIGLIAIFAFLVLLSSKVSATSNGIIIKNEKDLNAVRTDSGNNVTIQLKEGEYGLDSEKLSPSLKKALEADKTMGAPYAQDGYVEFYIPVPADASTKYSAIKYYELYNGKNTGGEALPEYLDENFKYVTRPTSDESETMQKAKYIRYSVSALVYTGNTSDGKKALMGGTREIQLNFYDKAGKIADTKVYKLQVRPKFSVKELRIDIAGGIIYSGSWNQTEDRNPTHGTYKGSVEEIKVSNNHFNEDLTSKAKITTDNEEIITISKDKKITAKNPGVANVIVEVEGVTKKVQIVVWANTTFTDTITKEQIADLVSQAKRTEYTDIYYYTEKDLRIPAEILKVAKEVKKDIYVDVYKDKFSYSWKIKSSDITDISKDLDISISKIDSFVDALKDKKDIIYLDFKHSGNLPAKSTITMYREIEDVIKDPKDEYLYHYNEQENKCEYVTTVKEGEYGELTFTIDHCSKYFISKEKFDDKTIKTINASISNRKLDGEPKTGEEFSIVNVCYIVIALSTLGLAVYKIKE